MIQLTTCPRCQRAVTLPEDVDVAASVRCPLCCAEYPLGEAIPPALVVVSKPEATAPAADVVPPIGLLGEPLFSQDKTLATPTDAAAVETDLASTPTEPPVSEIPARESADDDFAAAVGDGELGVEKPEDRFAFEFEGHLAESASDDAKEREAAEADRDTFPTVTGDHPSGDGSADRSGELAVNSAVDLSAPAAAVAERPRPPQLAPPRRPLVKPAPVRRRKKKGPIRLLIEWVAGLCLAVVGFYYGMWWIRGESAGLPRYDWAPFLPAPEPIAQMPMKPSAPANQQKSSPSAALSPNAAIPGNESRTSFRPETPNIDKETAVGLEKKVGALPGIVAPPAIEDKRPATGAAETPPEPEIGPRPPANFSFLDFDTAIDEATYALFNKSDGKVNAESYPAFCRMAEVQTYIPIDKQSPAQQKSVKILLDNVGKDREQLVAIGQLAETALKNPGERSGGILLAGKVTKISTSNNMFGAFIKLTGSDEVVVVLSAKEMPFKVEDEVLLNGGIVAKPSENVRGFKGKAPLAVWLGAAVPTSAAADKK
jgi:hypothetical protein